MTVFAYLLAGLLAILVIFGVFVLARFLAAALTGFLSGLSSAGPLMRVILLLLGIGWLLWLIGGDDFDCDA